MTSTDLKLNHSETQIHPDISGIVDFITTYGKKVESDNESTSQEVVYHCGENDYDIAYLRITQWSAVKQKWLTIQYWWGITVVMSLWNTENIHKQYSLTLEISSDKQYQLHDEGMFKTFLMAVKHSIKKESSKIQKGDYTKEVGEIIGD